MNHSPASAGQFRLNRRLTKLSLWLAAVLAAATAVVVVVTPSHAADPLRTLAAQRGKFIGFAGNAQLLCNNSATCSSGSDNTYRGLGQTEFNQLTPENAMKWEATEPNDNQYTFAAADGLVAFAAANNQTVHGHTMIWHQQTPGWVQGLSATAMRTAIQDHISTVIGRYANSPVVTGWDVVNEAFNEDGTRRQSFWQNTLGDSYIADAFRWARQADPDALLCYNDYNIESNNAKSTAVYNLVSSLKSQGVPIDCVGMQSHLGIQYGAPSGIQSQIERFASLGVTVRISELDIRMPSPSDSSKLSTQATYFGQVVNACNAVTACAGITIWGIDDGHSWIPDTFPDQCCGLLWNASYQQKPAYTAVSNALSGGTGGDTQAPTTPGTPTASNVTSSSVTLSWSASSDNVGVTGYDIYRAPGASGGSFASVGTSTSTSFTNSGLSASTTYRYQVRARDAAGNTSSFSSPVTVTTQSGGGGGSGCSASYTKVNEWPGGFQGEVKVTNNGTTATSGWTVTLTFPDGQRITQIWSGRTALSGVSPYTITNESYNGTIPAGGNTTFGFLGSWSGSNGAPTTTCSL